MAKPPASDNVCAETVRLREEASREKNWKRWGPYLSERQWGTVREDYSADGNVWGYFPHDHARSRAYRWGEDGLLGLTDRRCRLCFCVGLWNGKDSILKERLFGLTNPQGNHGEDVKESYFYLDATPTGSYLKSLYKYPQAKFPYDELVKINAERTRDEGEYELEDTGIFDESRYFDVQAEYAKAGPNDICIKLTISNRGPEAATCHVLGQLWFRNGWTWGARHDGTFPKPSMKQLTDRGGVVRCEHRARSYGLGTFLWHAEDPDELIFTENVTNSTRLYDDEGPAFAKDAFHEYLVDGDADAISPTPEGTKAAAVYKLKLAPGESKAMRFRLHQEDDAPASAFGDFDDVFDQRIREADEFYESIAPPCMEAQEQQVWRQSYAGLLWTKQFYHYVVKQWKDGDPALPPPPPGRDDGIRNDDWDNIFNYDVISMPDKWEYPWYAAWDLAFHMLPMARVDPKFAKSQLRLLMREWYMRPDGALPAYEFAFSDVNPPVHAWAVWRVYKMTGARGERDLDFLAACFHKLLVNFTWWVNRKDESGKHLFGGGFLGMDNVGVFDRSHPPKSGLRLEQADGTAWMAFYCVTMLGIALELASHDRSYEDIASKFFEHYAGIVHAMNTLGGTGLWDERDGFYYDQLFDPQNKGTKPLRVRSLVGVVPLFACGVLDSAQIDKLHGFKKRMNWFLDNQPDLARSVTEGICEGRKQYLLSVAPRGRLESVLEYVFREDEFYSPFGVRSLSKYHARRPYKFPTAGGVSTVEYTPAESVTSLFGGNSNWRGPIWFPLNYLLVEALQRYAHFFGDNIKVRLGVDKVNLHDASLDLQRRLTSLFIPGPDGKRPGHAASNRFADDPHWKDHVLFYEYFHGDTGRGCGAAHQTGWTALVSQCIEQLCRDRGEVRGGHVHGVRLASDAG